MNKYNIEIVITDGDTHEEVWYDTASVVGRAAVFRSIGESIDVLRTDLREDSSDAMIGIFREVFHERVRQDEQYGCPGPEWTDLEWLNLVEEEVSEAWDAARTSYSADRYRGSHGTREELIQLAAICIAAVEGLDKRYDQSAS